MAANLKPKGKASTRSWLIWLMVGVTLVPAAIRAFQRVAAELSIRYGGSFWIPVSEQTRWLPTPVRMALHSPPPIVVSGRLEWREVRPGFAVAELPVLANGVEVDAILLARLDPKDYRFIVRNDPSGKHSLDGWMRDLGAILVINGSYYGRDGRPATPVVVDGQAAGPKAYDAKQGAFVASDGAAGLVDLQGHDWRAALAGSRSAMVSYPLLLATDGSSRAPTGTGWLANRSFIGQDRSGLIILGTTRNAFFSLERLSAFLKQSPLDLALALDLDGGPVACQGVSLPNFKRRQCGRWELQIDNAGRAKVLPPLNWGQASMPIALAVLPR